MPGTPPAAVVRHRLDRQDVSNPIVLGMKPFRIAAGVRLFEEACRGFRNRSAFLPLINVTGQIIALAVLQGKGNVLAVKVEAVTVRLGVDEHGAEFFLSVPSVR